MRPEKAYFIIKRAFRYCDKIGYNHDNPQLLLTIFNTPIVKKALTKLINTSIKDDENLAVRWEIPYEETECYYDVNIESVTGNLHYISDRWNCTGRLKYLRDMLYLVVSC